MGPTCLFSRRILGCMDVSNGICKENVPPNKHEAFIRLRYGLLNHNVDNFQIRNVEYGNTPFSTHLFPFPNTRLAGPRI